MGHILCSETFWCFLFSNKWGRIMGLGPTFCNFFRAINIFSFLIKNIDKWKRAKNISWYKAVNTKYSSLLYFPFPERRSRANDNARLALLSFFQLPSLESPSNSNAHFPPSLPSPRRRLIPKLNHHHHHHRRCLSLYFFSITSRKRCIHWLIFLFIDASRSLFFLSGSPL